jgi:hypothetical protein
MKLARSRIGARVVLLFVVVCFVGTPLSGQLVPVGSDFRVNLYTTGNQINPRVTPLDGGGWVVVWEGSGLGDPAGVFGRAYDSIGAGGPPFRVNTTTTGVQEEPAVAGGSTSGFVVVWTTESVYEIVGQRYDNFVNPLGGQFRVNSFTTSTQNVPDVAMSPPGSGNGTFVVVWQSGEDGSSFSIQGQRYFSGGSPALGPFVVNSYTTGAQTSPRIALNADIDFVVTYSFNGPGDSDGVFARPFAIFDALSDDIRVNATTSSSQRNQSVTWEGLDSFVVVWSSPDAPDGGFEHDIYARRFSRSGIPLTGEFRVNSITTDQQYLPDVAAIGTGEFVVVWQSYFQPTDYDIFAQQVAGTSLVGPQIQLNSIVTGPQIRPRIARLASGRFVVVWQSDGQDGNGWGIFGRRLCIARGDANRNGTLAVDDVFYLINYLFAGGPAPLQNCDVDGSTVTDVGDVFYLINYLFAGGTAPVCA